jgi:hypothetical protein
MSKEKIYFEDGDLSVTASRVVLGDNNFVLRNISAVKVEKAQLGTVGKVGGAFLGLIGTYSIISEGIMIHRKPIFSDPYTEFNSFAFIFLGLGILLALLLKDQYFVQVSTGGTPANTVKSPNPDLPTKVVDAINNALLDLDNNQKPNEGSSKSNSSGDSTDEIMKLKGLLDAGAITQEEFDAKKKELLGL